MQVDENVSIKLTLKPDELQQPILNILKETYNKKIVKNVYIDEVLNIVHKSNGKIFVNGNIQHKIIMNCKTLNPCLHYNYKLQITDVNKMGALHKNELVTVFIPTQYFNNNKISVGKLCNVQIIGKRIEEGIICIGKL